MLVIFVLGQAVWGLAVPLITFDPQFLISHLAFQTPLFEKGI